MTEEWLSPTFCHILIFVTYAHPASLLLVLLLLPLLVPLLVLLLVLHNPSRLQWRVKPLQWSLPSTVTHLKSLTTGLCPGTQQLTYFRRLGLVALNSVCVIVSKIRPFLVLTRKRSKTWTFLFSNARWLLIICSCQNSQFQLLCTSL
jgi:uncharacterized integral membrane protein